jgi:hypothetical protein
VVKISDDTSDVGFERLLAAITAIERYPSAAKLLEECKNVIESLVDAIGEPDSRPAVKRAFAFLAKLEAMP